MKFLVLMNELWKLELNELLTSALPHNSEGIIPSQALKQHWQL
jgi:hypothetical protein